ncbi:MAG TPA: DUF4442 domain-containing protein [Gammaproteobacteria bacterium]|nr:DUF4442 domain-containing protein [Gammaproteobacteria bacterium]
MEQTLIQKWISRFIAIPGSRWLGILGIKLGAPYSATIHPFIIRVEPGHFEMGMKKRRAVTNHLRTVHAVAMANLVELTASFAVQASIPKTARWIPSGMSIQYLKKARTDLRSVCQFEPPDWHEVQDLPVEVSVFDLDDQEVATGVVQIRIGPKPNKNL